MPDKDVNPGIITKYASAIEEIDKGNFEKAATIAETVKEINPDFTYSDDLLKEIDVDILKIASFDLGNLPFINKIAQKKDIMLKRDYVRNFDFTNGYEQGTLFNCQPILHKNMNCVKLMYDYNSGHLVLPCS